MNTGHKHKGIFIHHPTLMLTPQTLLQRFLAHIAGINVGLHVEKYNAHFDCFDFFTCKDCLCVEKC